MCVELDDGDEDEYDGGEGGGGGRDLLTSSDDMLAEPFYDVPEGEDYLAIYETIDRKRLEAREFKVFILGNLLRVLYGMST